MSIDWDEVLHVAKHFGSNLFPVGFALLALGVVYLLGSVLFFNWVTLVATTTVLAGALTWFEYDAVRPGEASVTVVFRDPEFDPDDDTFNFGDG